MKIIIVGPAHPYRGGIAKFNETLAVRLTEKGDDVEIANFSMQYPNFLFPGKTQFTDDVQPEININRCVNTVNPFNWGKVARKIAKQKPDLVMFRYWMPFFAPAMGTIAKILKKKGVRTVALTDNIIPHEKHLLDKQLTNYFLKNIDKVVYMSEQVGRELKKFKYKGKTEFVPHPIYDTYGQKVDLKDACEVLKLDENIKYVLFFGFIREYKGLDLLLKAWREISVEIKGYNEKQKVKLLIAGEFYDNKELYVELIKELGIENEVILHDHYIPENKIKYYFSAAQLVVQPYKTATQSGITQVAYNFGVPMIVTNVGGLSEIVPDGKVGFVVEPVVSAIAMAIEHFFEQKLYQKFHTNIQSEKERFSWENMINAIIK